MKKFLALILRVDATILDTMNRLADRLAGFDGADKKMNG